MNRRQQPNNEEQVYPPQGQQQPPPPGYQQQYPPQYGYQQAPPKRHRLSALAWAALILGITGVVGSPIIFLNNLTAVVAGVGVILGSIALFGTRKIIAGIGVVICITAITFTVMAQGAAVESFGGGAEAAADVSVSNCKVVDEGFGLVNLQAIINITNSTDQAQTYSVTVSANDETGARIGEINAFSNSLAAGQSVTLSGMDASGIAPEGAEPGPVGCTVASVNRFAG